MPSDRDLGKCYSIHSYEHNDKWSFPDSKAKRPKSAYVRPTQKVPDKQQFKRIIKFYYGKGKTEDHIYRPRPETPTWTPYWRDQSERNRALNAARLKAERGAQERARLEDLRAGRDRARLEYVHDLTKKFKAKEAWGGEEEVREGMSTSSRKSSFLGPGGYGWAEKPSGSGYIHKMADSESERGAGSDIDDDDEPGFDPTADLEQMTEKERKKWEKNLQKWRIFMDFLFRHIAIATFKYNCFENEDLPQFMIALEKAEELREKMKLKKGEVPRISCYKVMRESTELLKQHKFINEANRIRKFLDICGRMKGISMIAGGFYKALKKGKVKGLDKIKYYLDYWKGFCVRSFDYNELQFRNTEPEAFNELEQKFMVWNASLRTCLNLSQKFLKKCSESTGLDLMNDDPKVQIQHMQAAEFVVAHKIEELLFQKVESESKNFLTGAAALLGGGARSMTPAPNSKWEIPDVGNIDPNLLTPIPDSSMMLSLPPEPPKDKKKKKGKGKGKKGRGKSAGSSKSKKKKKK